MTDPEKIDIQKWMAKGARILTDAPEEIKPVLAKVKMNQKKEDTMKNGLGHNSINVEMLANTLAYLLEIQVTDEIITGLLKEGKKERIFREVTNLMPLTCVTCRRDTEYQVGEKPTVRCRRCNRGACKECFPLPQQGWAYLCSICDDEVQKQSDMPQSFRKTSKKKAVEPATSQGIESQNIFEILSQEEEEVEEEEDELEEAAKKREEKRKQEEGGRKERKEEEKKTDICKAFKFGGKCPHGMSGNKQHKHWEQCNKSHPKVCNKLLTHGCSGRLGCDGKECGKYHPKLCYSSMNSKMCTKVRCTYWHIKGTSFAPESASRYEQPSRYSTEAPSRYSPENRARYEAPSRYSLDEYPGLPDRRGRSPRRRGQEVRHGPRKQENEAWVRDERRREEEQERKRREERRTRDEEQERRRREGGRWEERREEGKREEPAGFLDIAQIIRQEVQRAFLSLQPLPGASGSAASLPSARTTLPVSPVPNWAEIFGRCSNN